jgi:hypothetical protein
MRKALIGLQRINMFEMAFGAQFAIAGGEMFADHTLVNDGSTRRQRGRVV